MKMRQSIADFEAAFVEEIQEDRQRRTQIVRQAEKRSVQRRRQRQHRHGTMRFALLVLTLVATAVLVTIAMFETLYRVMG